MYIASWKACKIMISFTNFDIDFANVAFLAMRKIYQNTVQRKFVFSQPAFVC